MKKMLIAVAALFVFATLSSAQTVTVTGIPVGGETTITHKGTVNGVSFTHTHTITGPLTTALKIESTTTVAPTATPTPAKAEPIPAPKTKAAAPSSREPVVFVDARPRVLAVR